MILSQKNIEEIAVAVIRDFQKSFFGSEADDPARFALPTPIDQFASDYLNLKVSFQKLSSDGSIYGLTAYVDTEYQIEIDGNQRSIFLKTNDVVLDKSFIEPANIRKLCGKRRFTLAHECAHQILFQLDSDDRKIACHKRPEARGNGSRVLRTQEDWNEWQANTLGAAILMPQSEVDRAMWFINSRKPLTCYGWRFYDSDQVKIDTFCGVFGVSRSAAAIRLEQLGYLNRKKDYVLIVGKSLPLQATDRFSVQRIAAIRQGRIRQKPIEKRKKVITIIVSVYVLCVAVLTGLHTVSRNSVPRNVKSKTTTRNLWNFITRSKRRNQNAKIYYRRKNWYPVRTHRRLLLSLLDDRKRRTVYAHKIRKNEGKIFKGTQESLIFQSAYKRKVI